MADACHWLNRLAVGHNSLPKRKVLDGICSLLALALSVFIAFSVLAFGATEAWSATVCEVFLLALAGILSIRGKGFLRMPTRLAAPMFFIAGLVVIGVAQLVPLPVSAWRGLGDERGVISAEAQEAERLLRSEAYRTHPISGEVVPPDSSPAFTPEGPSWRPATFAPVSTLAALLALASAWALLLVLGRLGEGEAGGLRTVALVVGILGVIVGVTALALGHSESTKVLGFRESAHAAGAFGPFINENNGMGFVTLAFSFLYYLLYCESRTPMRMPNKLGIYILGMGTAGLHVTVILFRASASGFWLLLLFPCVILAHAFGKRPRLVAAGLTFAAFLATGLIAAAVYYRFTDFHGRIGIWTNMLAQDHFILGNGLASFRDRFPSVATDVHVREALLWIYPENEYLQLYFEAGFPGLLLGLGALGYVVLLGWRSILARGGIFLLVPALWAEALHAATDFPFHLWPVAASYLLLIAFISNALRYQHPGESAEPGSGARNPGGHHRGPSISGERLRLGET